MKKLLIIGLVLALYAFKVPVSAINKTTEQFVPRFAREKIP